MGPKIGLCFAIPHFPGNSNNVQRVKKVAPLPQKKHNIFTQAKYILVKFCPFVARHTYIYLHILTNFGRFILIFNKIALISTHTYQFW